MTKKPFDVLMPYWRDHPDWEGQKAEAMFERFIETQVSYDELSSHPDYLIFASAEMIMITLPQLIDEMLLRNDFDNYIVYQINAAIDPQGSQYEEVNERAAKVAASANKSFTEKVCQFLDAQKSEPPVPLERWDRLLSFWGKLNATSHPIRSQ